MAHAIATEDDFGIQYDDTIVCDVCREVRQQLYGCCNSSVLISVERR